MAVVNQECININIWNLKEIAKLSEKIKNQHGDSNCRSWRYPAKKSSEIDIHKLSENTEKCADYTYVLELIIDRTIYNLNLIINYLENLEGMAQFQPDKNTERPKTLSLATVLFMLWERIQQLSNSNTRFPLKNSEAVDISMKTSRSTQTELCKISKCSCCDMVQKFISHLVFDIEKILKNESALLEVRNNVKDIVENMSNWGAMSRWINAITSDVNNILEKLEKAKIDNQRLKDLSNHNEKSLKNQLSELKDQKKILKEKIKENELSIAEMQKQIEDLIDEKDKDDNQAAVTIIRLKEDLNKRDAIIRKLEEDKVAMKAECDKLLEIESRKSNEAENNSRNLLVVVEKLEDELKLKNDLSMSVLAASSEQITEGTVIL